MIISRVKIIAFQPITKFTKTYILFRLKDFPVYNEQKNTWILGITSSRFDTRNKLVCA